MNNQEKIVRLQRLITVSNQATSTVDRTICAVKAWRWRHPTAEDRAILDQLPIVTQVSYKHADQSDASMASQRLRCVGSIVASVRAEVGSDLIREQRVVP